MWHLFMLVVALTATSFGGGQILQAGLERELVQTGQIGRAEFAAAVALGHTTPGPLAAFTTAVGKEVGGVGGAIIATVAMMSVSLTAAGLVQRVPISWVKLPRVQAGLAQVPPLTIAFLFFLAWRTLPPVRGLTLPAVAVIGGVLVGKLCKLPTLLLVTGAVTAGALVG